MSTIVFLKSMIVFFSSFVHKVNGYINDADIYQNEAIYQAQVSDKDNHELAEVPIQ